MTTLLWVLVILVALLLLPRLIMTLVFLGVVVMGLLGAIGGALVLGAAALYDAGTRKLRRRGPKRASMHRR